MVQRGTTQRLEGAFFDAPDGDPADPTAITLTITYNGDEVLVAHTADMVHDSLGNYHYDWDVPDDASAGVYVATWEATLPDESSPAIGSENITVTTLPAGLPPFNGCEWPLDDDALPAAWSTYDEVDRIRAVRLASSTLYRLTGYRVGGCPVTVRPTRQNGSCGVFYADSPGFYPVNWAGTWRNDWCAADARLIELPAPVGRIDSVKVDGVELDPANYSIVDGHYLAWIGAGDPPWPATQDWVIPDTEVGTFSVTYLNSWPVDALGAYAASLLAAEFAKAATGKQCRLPSNVVSIARQGVSYEIAAGAFPDGKTQIREVDGFIETWNPKGRHPGVIFDPGAQRMHVQR